MSGVDATHDKGLRSWVAGPNQPGTDFPIQNLPFGVFRTKGGEGRIGVAIGEFLLGREGARTRLLAIAGAAMLAAGVAWSFAFPIVKDIWSSPFVLVTAGLTVLVLALLHHVLDREGRAPGTAATAMLAFGANAIAAYTLHQVTAGVVTWDLLLIPFRATRALLGDPVASLLPVLVYLVLIWAAMAWLRRKGWIIKI